MRWAVAILLTAILAGCVTAGEVHCNWIDGKLRCTSSTEVNGM